MEAPKCKICGRRHWGTCYTPDTKSTAAPVPQTAKRVPKAALPVAGEPVPATVPAVDTPKPKATKAKARAPRKKPAAAEPAEAAKPARKGNRHRPGYHAEYQRKRREAAKGTK